MGISYYAKAAIKSVTTPRMRDEVKKRMFQVYTKLFFSGVRQRDTGVFGVNLIGHIRGDFGLGESCRLVAGALRESGIPFSIYNVPLDGPAKETDTEWSDWESSDLKYNVNLIHINPNVLSNVIWGLNFRKLRGGYNIAYWLWELPEFPAEWRYTFELFDEIWTPAEFISQTLRKETEKPVFTMPYGLREPKTGAEYGRTHFGLPEDKFLLLMSYDGNSVSARKNPEGSIRAYRSAFSPEEGGVGLVIKATHEKAAELERLSSLLAGYPNVYILTESYGKEEFNSLLRCVDVYISLHRAEGFGLVMAEAMLLGTSVIATNWSANTEFMDRSVACMVDAEVVPLEKDYPPYHAGDHWAQPDEAQAAEWMRKLYRDRRLRDSLTAKAKAHLASEFSPKKAARMMEKRLLELNLHSDSVRRENSPKSGA